MKKIAIITLAVIMMVSCGGESVSGLKENKILGKIPAVYAIFIPEENALEKMQKEILDRSIDLNEDSEAEIENEYMLYEKEKERVQKMFQKYEPVLEADINKINGMNIPFIYTPAFEQLPCEIASLKIHIGSFNSLEMMISVIARKDFYQRSMHLYYRMVAKDGSTIAKEKIYLFAFKDDSFTKGQHLSKDEFISTSLKVHENPECWIDFAQIEFLTEEEYLRTKLTCK